MLFKSNGNENKILFINGTFANYFNEEGYKHIEIAGFDTPLNSDSYIVMYVVDKEKRVVNKVNLVLTNNSNPTTTVPLERLIHTFLENEIKEDCYLYEVDLKDLIGFECQVLVESKDGYYNITKVYPVDTELESFVSRKDEIKNRYPNGLFQKVMN